MLGKNKGEVQSFGAAMNEYEAGDKTEALFEAIKKGKAYLESLGIEKYSECLEADDVESKDFLSKSPLSRFDLQQYKRAIGIIANREEEKTAAQSPNVLKP